MWRFKVKMFGSASLKTQIIFKVYDDDDPNLNNLPLIDGSRLYIKTIETVLSSLPSPTVTLIFVWMSLELR